MKTLIFTLMVAMLGSQAQGQAITLFDCRYAAWDKSADQMRTEGFRVGNLVSESSYTPQHIDANTDVYYVTRQILLVTQNTKNKQIEYFGEEHDGTRTYAIKVQLINGQCKASLLQ